MSYTGWAYQKIKALGCAMLLAQHGTVELTTLPKAILTYRRFRAVPKKF